MDEMRPIIEGYVVESPIGAGAGGSVWRGHRLSDRAPVALKVIAGDPAQVAREVDAARSLNIDHVVRVHEVVPMSNGRVAVVMDLLAGGSLREVIAARDHLSPGEVVTVLVPIASALGALHRHGVVHSDVSPENVLFDVRGRPSLADLGACHASGQIEGDIWGSDGFVAPEVLLGGRPGAAADVYAVASLGLYCLTGRVPEPALGRAPVGDWLRELGRSDLVDHPLIATITQAMAPEATQRPDAVRWATLAYECAQAEPLLLLRGTDVTTGLTRRLRSAATVTPSAAPDASPAKGPKRWAVTQGRTMVQMEGSARSARGRHAAAAAVDAGARRGTGAGSRRGGLGRHGQTLHGQALHGRRAAVTVGRRSARVIGVLALLSFLLVGGGAAALDRWGERAATPATPTPSPTPATSSDARKADPRAVRSPMGAQITELVMALAHARAEAWMGHGGEAGGDAGRLDELSVVGSPARQQDEADLAALDPTSRFHGLRFTVLSADAVSAPVGSAVADTAVADPSGAQLPAGLIVRTRITTEAHTIVRRGQPVSVPAVQGAPVDLVLVWTTAGWRISDVRAVSESA